jgi:hypothetical protein
MEEQDSRTELEVLKSIDSNLKFIKTALEWSLLIIASLAAICIGVLFAYA